MFEYHRPEATETDVQPEVQFPKGYISLRNGAFRGKLTFIRCDVGLPPYVGEFGLRTRPLLHLARLAGFKSIRIVSSSKERSETQYNLQGGIAGDGTMRGSISTATTVVPEASSDLLYDDSIEDTYVPRGRMWGDLTVTLNTKEIQQRLMDEGKAANDRKTWAKHMNRAIATQIVSQGAAHLLRGGDIRNDRDAIIQGPLAAEVGKFFLDFLQYGNPITHPGEGIGSFALRTVFELLWFSYVWRWNNRRGNGPSRFSLAGVHGPAIDRAIALFGAAKAQVLKPMVKPAN